ncbi:conserved hypothetical protein [Methanoregula boonei 6A8]|uniref:DUF169 domain-containing protein n=1 Tax=Methanoregula boonei (strain DSM 21154 / JCM 14090 / 6A8) TaxID=456442 RepID=A7I5B6_METB6|nr:DUF169 domain-containing protein [Methanoregula boonei]ABS54927.1 conserved hypothetical protein [Methanoregula boonei 6A8]
MESIIAQKAGLINEPMAILWSNTKPEGALQMKPNTFTCVLPFIAQVAIKGKTVVFDRETYGCPGARAGLGFGNGFYDAFGGAGIDFMSAFFAKGIESSKDPDAYKAILKYIPEREQSKFIHGERIHKNQEKAKQYMINFPVTDIAEKYVIFTPLGKVKPAEKPVAVIFLADPIQLSGLLCLLGAIRDELDPVWVPAQMAACQQIAAAVYFEAKKEHPRAVLGYTDIAARENVGKTIPKQMFTFGVPYSLFLEMEEEAKDGVFDGPIWNGLAAEQKGTPA